MFSDNVAVDSDRLVEVVIPVYNEEKALPGSIATLHRFLDERCPFPWRIVIADNASTDATPEVAQTLGDRLPRVHYKRIPYKGRGRALRTAWLETEAAFLAYMDVDLSTDLRSFLPMIEKLAAGDADIVCGSRYMKGAQVTRGFRREVLSRGYIALLKLFFRCGFTDSQCGFKAITREAARALVPLVENQGWFFDTELLLLAERYGFRVAEVPVVWVDDPDSRVRILQTVSEHFIGLLRMRLAFSTGFAARPEVSPSRARERPLTVVDA